VREGNGKLSLHDGAYYQGFFKCDVPWGEGFYYSKEG
jgi:hypothetical protein